MKKNVLNGATRTSTPTVESPQTPAQLFEHIKIHYQGTTLEIQDIVEAYKYGQLTLRETNEAIHRPALQLLYQGKRIIKSLFHDAEDILFTPCPHTDSILEEIYDDLQCYGGALEPLMDTLGEKLLKLDWHAYGETPDETDQETINNTLDDIVKEVKFAEGFIFEQLLVEAEAYDTRFRALQDETTTDVAGASMPTAKA